MDNIFRNGIHRLELLYYQGLSVICKIFTLKKVRIYLMPMNALFGHSSKMKKRKGLTDRTLAVPLRDTTKRGKKLCQVTDVPTALANL